MEIREVIRIISLPQLEVLLKLLIVDCPNCCKRSDILIFFPRGIVVIYSLAPQNHALLLKKKSDKRCSKLGRSSFRNFLKQPPKLQVLPSRLRIFTFIYKGQGLSESRVKYVIGMTVLNEMRLHAVPACSCLWWVGEIVLK